MKPRNKIERQILALAEKLPPITERQRRYAYDHCFTPRAVYKPRRREVRCLCCGQTAVWPKPFLESFIDTEQYDCPYCNAITSIEQHLKTTEYNERRHFTILTTFRGHQVARTFEVARTNDPNENFAEYDINEIFQNWILDDGREIITGRRLYRSPLCMIWKFHLPLEIHQHNATIGGYYQYDDIYTIAGNTLYPDIRVTPLVRRNGWTRRLLDYRNRISLTDAISWILSVPTAEMLVKTGQLDLFMNMIRSGKKDIPVHAVRIANRRRYIVSDAHMWLDMLSMAAELGLDTHNPKIVCPDDLRQAHDSLLPRIRRLHERQRHVKELREASVKWDEKYAAEKKPFFGIRFSDDEITVSVIESLKEMADEGEAMHHCVFRAGYYKRPDSLILSARDHDGNRLETVEVSLETFKVIQSRAKFNQNSPFHDRIIRLVRQNMNLIANRARCNPS